VSAIPKNQEPILLREGMDAFINKRPPRWK